MTKKTSTGMTKKTDTGMTKKTGTGMTKKTGTGMTNGRQGKDNLKHRNYRKKELLFWKSEYGRCGLKSKKNPARRGSEQRSASEGKTFPSVYFKN